MCLFFFLFLPNSFPSFFLWVSLRKCSENVLVAFVTSFFFFFLMKGTDLLSSKTVLPSLDAGFLSMRVRVIWTHD